VEAGARTSPPAFSFAGSRHRRGVKWWKILEDGIMQEPWDIEFQDSRTASSSRNRLRERKGLFHDRRRYDWSERTRANGPFLALSEWRLRVAERRSPAAMAVRSGRATFRSRAPQNWVSHSVPGSPRHSRRGGLLSTQEAWIVGSTGFVRRSQDSGQHLVSLNHGELHSVGRTSSRHRAEAVIVGHGLRAKCTASCSGRGWRVHLRDRLSRSCRRGPGIQALRLVAFAPP